MTGPSWLIDSRRIATKIKNASEPVDPSKLKWMSNPTRECPRCNHVIDNSDVVHDWPGLPKGVKFDPSDQELLWHLLAKLGKSGVRPHPFINEFIPTVEADEGICYTHPQKLPGVKQDGSVSHFFHRTFKAYNTGTRKRRKINIDDLGDVRWHKTGKTKPVIINGKPFGCKKILVLYISNVKGVKPEKTNWVMHQYHLGIGEDEMDGEYVVSKLFYQQQSKPDDKNAHESTALEALESVAAEAELLDCPPLLDCAPFPPEEHASDQEAVVNSECDADQVNRYCEAKDEENIFHPSPEKPEDQDYNPSQETKWWEGESQFLLDSQQLAEGMAICDEFLQSQTSCGSGEEPKKNKPRLADYAKLPAEDLKKDLEECQKLGNIENTNLELEAEFRLSQIEFSQDSFLATWAGGKMAD